MISILNILGVHPGDIDHAYEECENAFGEANLEMPDSFDDMIAERSEGVKLLNSTSALIEIMFSCTKETILKKRPDLSVTYYVNGYDSHVYVEEEDISLRAQYDYSFEDGAKEDVLNEIVRLCDDLDAGDKITLFDFGKDRDLVTHIYKDEDFWEETGEWNLVTLHTALDGEFVDDTEDTHVTDGSLFKELDRIWEHRDFATL